jgi:hypothetical protein
LGDCTYRVSPSWQPPEEQGAVERCEVKADPATGGYLVFKRMGYAFPMRNEVAQSDPDFIAYEYADGIKCSQPRITKDGMDTPALAPAAVLFRRRT